MHDLLVSPFIDGYLACRPGSVAGLRLPEAGYEELRTLGGAPAPEWFAEAAAETWGVDLRGKPLGERLLVRGRSAYGFGKASWEINLGCNFGCKHCYLGVKEFSGLPLDQKFRLLDIMREAGVLFLQITGGEPTIDKDFQEAYRYAYSLGMMLTISTNASRLWDKSLLAMFEECPPYRVVVSVYGATERNFDALTERRGAWKSFVRGMDAAREAKLPIRLHLIITSDNAAEANAMVAMAEEWGLAHHTFSNISPTIYGGPETLLAQSTSHIAERKPFGGCNAGVTFFHADPHAKVSICKIGRDQQIDLMAEGTEGLNRLGGISDALMLRTGGCTGCQLSGSCTVCRPLAKRYQEAKAPLDRYCQHGRKEVAV